MGLFTNHWYSDTIKVSPIVMEASPPEDREYMRKMSKEDVHQVNGALIQGLYKTILDRKNCDFGDIPDSKGDFTKCKYYSSTMESLSTIKELMIKNEIPFNEVDDINEAIGNVRRFQSTFEMGFNLKQDYLILFYNTIVMAIIDSTSMVIAKYMDYLVGPNQSTYETGKSRDTRGWLSLDNLRRFNNEVKVGHFESMANYILDSQRKNFTGVETIAVTGLVIVALTSVIPLTRELIYFYYRSKVRLSDYLNMQADFLELNKLGVEATTKSAQQKKEILKKQEKIILKCRRTADKLKINDEDIGVLAKKQVENDNRGFSLKTMEKQIFNNKMDGVSLNII